MEGSSWSRSDITFEGWYVTAIGPDPGKGVWCGAFEKENCQKSCDATSLRHGVGVWSLNTFPPLKGAAFLQARVFARGFERKSITPNLQLHWLKRLVYLLYEKFTTFEVQPFNPKQFFVDLTGLPNTVEEVSQAPGLSATKQTNETQALVTFGETGLGKSCHLRKYTLVVIGGFQMLKKVHDVRQWQVATSTQVHFACQVYFNLQHFLLLLFLKKRLFLDRKVRHKLVTGHFLFSSNTSCMTLPLLYCESDKPCRNINRMLQDHTRWHDIMIHGTLFQTSGTYIFQESGCSRPVFWPIPNLIWQESYHHFVSIPSWTDSHFPPQEQF